MEAKPIRRVMVGVDERGSRNALAYAAGLARSMGADLVLVHVCDPVTSAVEPPWYLDCLTPILEARRKVLEQTVESLRGTHPGAQAILRLGVTHEELWVAANDARADLVVLGAPRRGVWSLRSGVSKRFAGITNVPVVLVPP